jgi:formylglycine-generating enzyme
VGFFVGSQRKDELMKTTAMLALLSLSLLLVPTAHAVVTFDWVTVGNPGNAADTEVMSDGTTGYGAVGYTYSISKFEVTAGQYTEFLNAVADSDPYGLYDLGMWTDSFGYGCRIERSGIAGSYTYTVATDRANRPVNYVSWGDAARFANWLHNGQPIGPQDLTTTEDGAYYLNGALSWFDLVDISREVVATHFLPSEDEWYKAAYYDPNTGAYYEYPTSSNSVPSNDLIDPDSGNNANFYDDWGPTIGSPYWTTEVGEFENSESPYGTFDQGGNLWEWNEAVISDLVRGSRGGSCFDKDWVGHLSSGSRLPYGLPHIGGSDQGFRVARLIPEPSSFTLSLCMIPGVLRRKWWG